MPIKIPGLPFAVDRSQHYADRALSQSRNLENNSAPKPLALSGIATIPSGGSVAIIFDAVLSDSIVPSLTPIGTAGQYATAYNVTGTGMTIYLFDVAGNPISGTVRWKVE